MPGYLIGSSKLRWLKSHRTAKLAPWSEERAEAGGTAATAARSEATAAKTATATSIPARVPPGGTLAFLAGVAGDDLEGVELGVELARDAVEEADGASHEEQAGWYVAHARAEPHAEVSYIRFAHLAAEEHADELEQGDVVRVFVNREAGLPERGGERVEVAVPHGADHPLQRGYKGRLEGEGEPVVEEDEARLASPRMHEEVARVRVGVEDAAPEKLVCVDVHEEGSDLARFDPSPGERLFVRDLDPLHEVHDEEASRREVVHDPGDDGVVAVREGASQVLYGRGLAAEVQLEGERPAQVVGDGLELDLGLQTRDRAEDGFQSGEVGFDQGRNAGVLDLDGDLPPVREPGAVYLRDRSGGNRFPFELGEDLGHGSAQLAGDGFLDNGVGLGRHTVLEGEELFDVGCREEVRAGRGELSGLDQGSPERLRRVEQPPGPAPVRELPVLGTYQVREPPPPLAQRRVTQVEVRRQRAEQGDSRRRRGRKEAVRRPVSLVRAPQALPRRERGPHPQEPLRPREVAGAREVSAVRRLLCALAHRLRLLARAPHRPREHLPCPERGVAPQASRVQPPSERVLRAVGRLHYVSLLTMATEYMPKLARRRPLDERCPRSVYSHGDVGGHFGDSAGSRGGKPWGRRIKQPESRERRSGASNCWRSS